MSSLGYLNRKSRLIQIAQGDMRYDPLAISDARPREGGIANSRKTARMRFRRESIGSPVRSVAVDPFYGPIQLPGPEARSKRE